MAAVLHEDILRLIFNQICGDEHDGILALSRLVRVSRQFYMVATPFFYRCLHLESNSERDVRKLEALIIRLITNTAVISFIREIHIHGIHFVEEPGALIEGLKAVFSRLTRLDAFSWYPRDHRLLPVLQCVCLQWPDCRLHPLSLDIGSQEGRQMVEIIPHKLHHLSLCMPREPVARNTAKKDLVKAIKKCTNARSLNVSLEPPGCKRFRWSSQEVRVELLENDKIPCLSDVSIRDPPFPWNDFRKWGQKGGWSVLESLTLRKYEQLPVFQGCEATLRSLNIIDGWEIDDTALGDFCSNLECLEELRICGTIVEVPVDTLRRCGQHLKRLEVHTYGFDCPSYYMERLEASLKPLDMRINEWCPSLSFVALDVKCNDEEWVSLLHCFHTSPLVTSTSYIPFSQH